MAKPRTSTPVGAHAAPGAQLPWEGPPLPEAGAAPRRVLGRDALNLRIQVEALLMDPRGHFRPRPLTLRSLQGEREELLVTQVGELDDGSLSVVTPEPLVPGACFHVGPTPVAAPGRDAPVAGSYLVTHCRPGNRPEDNSQACWISQLSPEPEVPPTGDATDRRPDGA